MYLGLYIGAHGLVGGVSAVQAHVVQRGGILSARRRGRAYHLPRLARAVRRGTRCAEKRRRKKSEKDLLTKREKVTRKEIMRGGGN